MSKLKQQPLTIARKVTETKTLSNGFWKGSSLARWLHLYLSMVCFVVVLFFAVTGFTLNHADWFEASQTNELTGKLDKRWLKQTSGEGIDKLAIVEQLRQQHSLRGMVSDFRIEELECFVSFRGPGYTADVIVDREAATYQLTETRMGVVSVLNDLHKGRDTGSVWAGLIDVAAIFMTLVSLTGLWLLFYLKRRRISGLLWLAIGGTLCLILYGIFV